jgi:hypothetical protein
VTVNENVGADVGLRACALIRHKLLIDDEDVAMSEVVRAIWVDRLFFPDLPARSAGPIMLAHYEAQSRANRQS